MVVQDFLSWVEDAATGSRAEGANALAKAYLYGEFLPDERREAELALTALLDDTSATVRRAIAEAFASAVEAPRHIITALMSDHSDVASPVLSRSPLLRDNELIDCAATGDVYAQIAIALRAGLSATVSAALAEIGTREAVITLCVNESANLPEFSQRRLLERFKDDGEVREALLGRLGLSPAVRMALVEETARALTQFATSCAWLTKTRAERVQRESCEKAALTIAVGVSPVRARVQTVDLVKALHASGNLTTAFLLRALLCANVRLVEVALSEISGLSTKRVCGLLLEPKSAGFRALCRKASVPDVFVPALRSALCGLREERLVQEGIDYKIITGESLLRPLIARVIKDCTPNADKDMQRLLVMLNRLEAEAAREDAKLYQDMRLDKLRQDEHIMLTEPTSAVMSEDDTASLDASDILDGTSHAVDSSAVDAPVKEDDWIDPGSAWLDPQEEAYYELEPEDAPEDWQHAA